MSMIDGLAVHLLPPPPGERKYTISPSALAVLVAALLPLSACGVKGDLMKPSQIEAKKAKEAREQGKAKEEQPLPQAMPPSPVSDAAAEEIGLPPLVPHTKPGE